jgi:hypothetical protein
VGARCFCFIRLGLCRRDQAILDLESSDSGPQVYKYAP